MQRRGGVTREANWRAECEREAADAWQAVEDGTGYHRITYHDRPRQRRPLFATAAIGTVEAATTTSAAAVATAAVTGTEAVMACSKQQGRRGFAHDSIVQLLQTYLKACGLTAGGY